MWLKWDEWRWINTDKVSEFIRQGREVTALGERCRVACRDFETELEAQQFLDRIIRKITGDPLRPPVAVPAPIEQQSQMKSPQFPSRSENPDGLHEKYIILKRNGRPIDHDARYFVLRIDWGDQREHAIACRKAAYAWARSIINSSDRELQKAAHELITWLNQTGGDERKGSD